MTASAGEPAGGVDPGHEGALRPMRLSDIDAVLAVEAGAYSHPWTRGNFIDSLVAGYWAELRVLDEGVACYYVAMPGAGELHLLNLTVAPGLQGRGHGRSLIGHLCERCRTAGLDAIWLEVRVGNQRARRLYREHGFAEVGVRRGYYPAGSGGREDAIVMTLRTEACRAVD